MRPVVRRISALPVCCIDRLRSLHLRRLQPLHYYYFQLSRLLSFCALHSPPSCGSLGGCGPCRFFSHLSFLFRFYHFPVGPDDAFAVAPAGLVPRQLSDLSRSEVRLPHVRDIRVPQHVFEEVDVRFVLVARWSVSQLEEMLEEAVALHLHVFFPGREATFRSGAAEVIYPPDMKRPQGNPRGEDAMIVDSIVQLAKFWK